MSVARVIVVDDSALARQVLQKGLEADPQIEVLATASDPFKAAWLIKRFRPNVLTLDVEMPGINGLEFLKLLMKKSPLPVVMVSSLTDRNSKITLEALAHGAVDFVLKPRTSLQHMLLELRTKVKIAANVKKEQLIKNLAKPTINKVKLSRSLKIVKKIIAIGASTGGTEAIRKVLEALPAQSPGVVVVQHLPAGFTEKFARRLNDLTELQVKEARTGDVVEEGTALIAPGNYHMQVVRVENQYRVVCRQGPPVNGHRPAVEVLFRSVARHAGANAIGVMLTGMGADGAEGMVAMRRAGARTVAQDETTSVVFGMPREAFLRGGAERLAPIDEIPNIINAYLNGTL